MRRREFIAKGKRSSVKAAAVALAAVIMMGAPAAATNVFAADHAEGNGVYEVQAETANGEMSTDLTDDAGAPGTEYDTAEDNESVSGEEGLDEGSSEEAAGDNTEIEAAEETGTEAGSEEETGSENADEMQDPEETECEEAAEDTAAENTGDDGAVEEDPADKENTETKEDENGKTGAEKADAEKETDAAEEEAETEAAEEAAESPEKENDAAKTSAKTKKSSVKKTSEKEKEEENSGKLLAGSRRTYKGFEYEVNSNKQVIIYKYDDRSKTVNIPAKIEGYPVTEIGTHAFEGSHMASLTIPETITKIGIESFSECRNLSSIVYKPVQCKMSCSPFRNAGADSDSLTVTFAEGVEEIPNYLFDGDWLVNKAYNHVTKAVFPSTLTSIGTYAFNECRSLQTIIWGANVKTICQDAFYGCEALTKANLPSGLKTIGSSAFQKSGIRELTIPASVTSLSGGAFAECYDLSSVSYNVKTNGYGEAYFKDSGRDAKSLKVTLGKNVKTIPQNMFMDSCITAVTIPSSVREIQYSAFDRCNKLTSLSIPDSVKIINCAFSDCKNLNSVKIYGKDVDMGIWPVSGLKSSFKFYCVHGSTIPDYAKYYKFKYAYLDLGVVKSFKAANKTNGIQLTWKKLSGAKKYEICRRVGTGKYTKVKTINSGSTVKWTDTSVKNGKTYRYLIKGVNGDKKSYKNAAKTITRK